MTFELTFLLLRELLLG